MIPELPQSVAATMEGFTGRTWLLPPILTWLDASSERLFILQGGPGTGKSSLIAWLAGAGPMPSDPQARAQLERIRSQVKAVHFCLAKSGNTAPKAFAQSLAEQLTRHVDGFGQALTAVLPKRVRITSKVRTGSVQAGGSVTGVAIGRLDLGELGDELSFDRVLREPLQRLYAGGTGAPLLILVDALDEALTYTGSITLVHLLAKLADLPAPVRFLVTTRPDPRVLYLHHQVRPFDLIEDAPAGVDDVRQYAYERLAGLDEAQRSALAARISQAAEGIFLYAHLVLNDVLAHLARIPDLESLPLPRGLSGLYLDFLNRELGVHRERWFNTFKPVLGLIAVGQGEGLSRRQLERITGGEVEEALEVSRQYLDGAWPDGPFRPFHKSFADFLLEDKTNVAYHIDAARSHAQIADTYWAFPDGGARWRTWDDYGLRYAATHLAEAARGDDLANRHTRTERLVRLVLDPDFQQAQRKRVPDLTVLQRNLEQALGVAADDPDPGAFPLVVESALALVAFRREQQRPEPLFALARNGAVEAAARWLDRFDIDPDWRTAAFLTIAWLAAEAAPGEARSLRQRIRPAIPASGPLAGLSAWLDAALEGIPVAGLEPLPPPPPEEVVAAIVARIEGQGANAELLTAQGLTGAGGELLSESGYFAEVDGPPLVAYVAAHPQEGEAYFKRYLATHTGYNYVQYRNRSLWLLLGAVLRHPEAGWVRESAAALASAALAGSALEFQEALPIALVALQARVGVPGALHMLELTRDQALEEARKLTFERGPGDSWGAYSRRLFSLAQAFSVLLGRHAEASELLDTALQLPYGFAGFQSLTCLALAEAIQVCRPGDEAGVAQALAAAQRAAHNIQDAVFCARRTARVNAMRERWWRPGFDVVSAARRLRQDPAAPEFAAMHCVGEAYEHRSGQEKLPLPDGLRQANTLQALAQAYDRPPADIQRLNPGWALDEPLPPGTWVNIPDAPGFPALIAARFAAEALVAPALSDEERMALIQSLVPVAAINPTALDTVLARLALAARPTDSALLDSLGQLAARSLEEGAAQGLAIGGAITRFVP